MRLRLLWAGGAIAALGSLALAVVSPLNNYDTAYALLWGRDLAAGHAPDLEVPLAPTPHPLATLFGFVLSLLGRGDLPYSSTQTLLWQTTAHLTLVALGVLVFLLGRRWFGTGSGIVAALVVLTREPVLSFGLRAYVDLPYLVLLLAALYVESGRPRAGTPVLVLLAIGGLLRPEAWLFAGLYALWLWRGGTLRPGHVVLAAAAPVLWALSDFVLTNDPLWSLTGTRENADELGRVTGLDDVPLTLPRRLGEILREPVLLGAAGGGVLTLLWRRERAVLPAAAGLAAVAAFCVLAAAGLPIITRYLLLPATLLAIFAGAGALGWTALDRDDPRRRPWQAFGAVTLVALLAFAPAQADRLDRLRGALTRQADILDDLQALFVPSPRSDKPLVDPRDCGPITLPNRRAIPQVRLWTGLDRGDVRSGQDDGVRGTYLAPSSSEVAADFVLDRRDRNRRLPPPPAGVEPITVGSWLAFRRC